MEIFRDYLDGPCDWIHLRVHLLYVTDLILALDGIVDVLAIIVWVIYALTHFGDAWSPCHMIGILMAQVWFEIVYMIHLVCVCEQPDRWLPIKTDPIDVHLSISLFGCRAA